MNNHPLIAIPCGGDSIKVNCFTSLVNLSPVKCHYRSASGATPDLRTVTSSLIPHARGLLLQEFLKGSWSHLFFIDSDVGFLPDQFSRVLHSGFDICAGVYPYRKETLGYPIDPAGVDEPDAAGFANALSATTGFMCIKREVLVTMLNDGFKLAEIFDTHVDEEGFFYSEDIAFCMRAREAGFKITIDTKADLSHMGSNEFRSDFVAFLAKHKADNLPSEPVHSTSILEPVTTESE